MSDETEVMKPYKVVCTGVAELADGKLGTILQQVNDDGTVDPRNRIFDEKKCTKAFIRTGGVYEIEANDTFTRAFVASPKYQGMWANEHDRVKWQATERSIKLARAAKKQMKDDVSQNAMMDVLAPIREAYRKTNHLGRLAIEVQVLAYLRNVKAD